jgi:large subunit ribosomal protein L29
MKSTEMREKNADELRNRERDLGEKLYKLRFQQATGRLENPMEIRKVKREIARIKTILVQKANA